MPRSHLVTRLRGFALIAAVWTVIALFGVLSSYIRITSGELKPGPGWYWVNLGVIPLWAVATPPILALSRRFPLERKTWHLALLVHAPVLVIVLAIDGLLNMAVSPGAGGHVFTFWQQMWRYSFIDAFFYAGVVMVEHAGRYYRLYLDRRVHASELEAQVSRAQLQALQMQIRPHFLFNTLNTISGLVRVDDKATAITMLAGLGDLLRLLLRSDGAQEVTVRQELELIEHYLQIEQVRFGDRLAVEVHVQRGVEDALVPNLILQPLVENAVRHGIARTSTAGRIEISARADGADLVLTVRDDGPGYRPAGAGGGVGLANTRSRLATLFGDAARLHVRELESGGTLAEIRLPLRRGDGA